MQSLGNGFRLALARQALQPLNLKALTFCLLAILLSGQAGARPGPIDKATIKMREDILRRVSFVEVQRLDTGCTVEGYGDICIVAKAEQDAESSRELIAQFKRLPFERVTLAKCHYPGFALRLLDSDRNLIAIISLCWQCHNLQGTYGSSAEFREYKEDFAADSKRGMSFQRRLDGLVPNPTESPKPSDAR